MAKKKQQNSISSESDDEKGESVSAITLQEIADRLSGAASLYDQAAKQLAAEKGMLAYVRNMPQMRVVITKVENSASKAVIDVGVSIKAKRRANEALNAEAAANNRERKAN